MNEFFISCKKIAVACFASPLLALALTGCVKPYELQSNGEIQTATKLQRSDASLGDLFYGKGIFAMRQDGVKAIRIKDCVGGDPRGTLKAITATSKKPVIIDGYAQSACGFAAIVSPSVTFEPNSEIKLHIPQMQGECSGEVRATFMHEWAGTAAPNRAQCEEQIVGAEVLVDDLNEAFDAAGIDRSLMRHVALNANQKGDWVYIRGAEELEKWK